MAPCAPRCHQSVDGHFDDCLCEIVLMARGSSQVIPPPLDILDIHIWNFLINCPIYVQTKMIRRLKRRCWICPLCTNVRIAYSERSRNIAKAPLGGRAPYFSPSHSLKAYQLISLYTKDTKLRRGAQGGLGRAQVVGIKTAPQALPARHSSLKPVCLRCIDHCGPLACHGIGFPLWTKQARVRCSSCNA
jgi:hypothetical protein